MADSEHGQKAYELRRHLTSLTNLAEQTYSTAKQAEQYSRVINQDSLALKLLDIQHKLCLLQLTLRDPEIKEWIGSEMHIPSKR